MFIFLFLKLLFRLFSSLFVGLCIAQRIICGLGILTLWFGLFNFRVVYYNALSLYFGRNDMSKTIALQRLMVYFLDIKSGLKAHFRLSLDCFLNHLFLYILFSIRLFNLRFYRGLKFFPEESNKVGLFWSSISIKF